MWCRSSLQSSPSAHDEISHLRRRYIHQRLFCALTVCRQLWLNQRVQIVIYYMCTVCMYNILQHTASANVHHGAASSGATTADTMLCKQSSFRQPGTSACTRSSINLHFLSRFATSGWHGSKWVHKVQPFTYVSFVNFGSLMTDPIPVHWLISPSDKR